MQQNKCLLLYAVTQEMMGLEAKITYLYANVNRQGFCQSLLWFLSLCLRVISYYSCNSSEGQNLSMSLLVIKNYHLKRIAPLPRINIVLNKRAKSSDKKEGFIVVAF